LKSPIFFRLHNISKKQAAENHYTTDFNVLSFEGKSAAGHPRLLFRGSG